MRLFSLVSLAEGALLSTFTQQVWDKEKVVRAGPCYVDVLTVTAGFCACLWSWEYKSDTPICSCFTVFWQKKKPSNQNNPRFLHPPLFFYHLLWIIRLYKNKTKGIFELIWSEVEDLEKYCEQSFKTKFFLSFILNQYLLPYMIHYLKIFHFKICMVLTWCS